MNPLFVDDLVNAFILAMENPISYGSVYGIAGDDIVSNFEFIELCGKVSCYQPNYQFIDSLEPFEKYDTGRSWLEQDIVADCCKIKTELRLEFTPLVTALEETFFWLKNNISYLESYSK